MAKTGPIIIIEDDIDDQEMYAETIKDLGTPNELVFFTKCSDAFKYLKSNTKQPFLILCDINLPQQNGLDFKKQIDNDQQLRKKSVPFIFISTDAGTRPVTHAFTEMTIQGYFQKPYNIAELKITLSLIIEYWKRCRHPNSDVQF